MRTLDLAAHPAATPALLGAIDARIPAGAHHHDPALWAALLAHPATPASAVARALRTLAEHPGEATGAVVCAAAVRAGAGERAAVEVVISDARWIGELAGVGGHDVDALIRLVEVAPEVRHIVLPAMIDCPLATFDQVRALALALARDPAPLPAARTWLSSLVERRARPWSLELAGVVGEASGDADVQGDMRALGVRLEHARFITSLVVAGASELGTAAGWLRAMAAHPDPDGTLARAAFDAHPTPEVCAAVARSTGAGTGVRLRALLGAEPGSALSLDGLRALTAGASARELRGAGREVSSAAGRGVLLGLERLPGREVAEIWKGARGDWPLVAWQVALHPRTPPAVRRDVLDVVARSPAGLDRLLPVVSEWDRVGPGGASLLLPVAMSWPEGLDAGVGFLRWLGMRRALPMVDHEDHAAALLSLLDDFEGSVSDLFAVAGAVAAAPVR